MAPGVAAQFRAELERIGDSAHLCIEYGAPQERLATTIPFIESGLARGERCVYVAGPENASAVLSAMRSAEGAGHRSGAFSVVPRSETYLGNGPFVPDVLLAWIKDNAEAAVNGGFTAFRAVGDMATVSGTAAGAERLPEFEAKLDVFLAARSFSGLCEYDRNRVPAAILRDVVAVHPFTVSGALLCRNMALPVRQEFRALQGRFLELLEVQRRDIAHRLHDEVGQILVAIHLRLLAASRARRKKRTDTGGIESLLDEALEALRAFARDVRPSLLDDAGLAAALRSSLGAAARKAGIDLHLQLEAVEAHRLPPALETACFRVAEEALANAVRHSGARRAEVAVTVAEGAVAIAIRDDGRGFDVAAARRRALEGATLGLLEMEERSSLAGGRLAIDSTAGGTTVRARFALAEARPR
jgi:signal transduction histidine kinase